MQLDCPQKLRFECCDLRLDHNVIGLVVWLLFFVLDLSHAGAQFSYARLLSAGDLLKCE